MARLVGPDEGSREAKTINAGGFFKSKAGRTATIYTDSGGTSLADILTYPGGVAYSGSQVPIDDYSMLPVFQFPDGVDTLYAVVDSGPVWPIYARTDDRLDALAASQAAHAADTTDVHGIADTSILETTAGAQAKADAAQTAAAGAAAALAIVFGA